MSISGPSSASNAATARLIALIKIDDTIKKILSAMGQPCPYGA
ncbi:MAG TPA: hypothetical protein VF550_11665 [Polyangia bacterium]